MEPIFLFHSYKSYLTQSIENYPGGGRGVRKRLAQYIGCQIAYVTHVLNGEAHFSPEQGEAAARFFRLSPGEIEYFLLLIAHNRAGTLPLRQFYEKQLGRCREESKLLKRRLDIEDSVRDRGRQTYYSSWHYAAVHMATLSPRLNTPAQISAELGISATRTREVLSFLVKLGLVSKAPNGYQATTSTLHLERSSPHIAQHHTNWRMKAIQSLEELSTEDLHYSGVVACSREDAKRLQEKWSRCLEESIAMIRESPSEELFVLSFDVFSLRRGGR